MAGEAVSDRTFVMVAIAFAVVCLVVVIFVR